MYVASLVDTLSAFLSNERRWSRNVNFVSLVVSVSATTMLVTVFGVMIAMTFTPYSAAPLDERLSGASLLGIFFSVGIVISAVSSWSRDVDYRKKYGDI